jgi:nitroreductase
MTLLERRSIRKYKDFKISDQELLNLINETQRAPSSRNLQPIRYFIVRSEAGKDKLRACFDHNKSQFETSSALICMFGDLERYTFLEKIYNQACELGYMPKEVMECQISDIMADAEGSDPISNREVIILNAGIAAMQLMTVAKNHGYDTCCIHGFNKDLINEALGIEERYFPIMIVSIGIADEPGHQTYRLDASEITTLI